MDFIKLNEERIDRNRSNDDLLNQCKYQVTQFIKNNMTIDVDVNVSYEGFGTFKSNNGLKDWIAEISYDDRTYTLLLDVITKQNFRVLLNRVHRSLVDYKVDTN